MFKSGKKVCFTLCFLLSAVSALFSQGTVNAPVKACLGDVTSFSYTPPSGLTLSSANWTFGDGFSSSALSPVHTYTGTGKFTVIIQATFTNSTTATDSAKIEVFGLPKAAFYFDPKSDTCLTRNKVCFVDTSRPAVSGQAISNRIIVWGDGTFNQASFPGFGQRLCHTYAVHDQYTIKMELTDIQGCKNSVTSIVNVVENIDPGFVIQTEFTSCSTARVCVKNTSIAVNTNTAHYKWYIDTSALDTLHYFFSFKCVPYSQTRSGTAMLVAHANNNCRDTMKVPFNILLDPLPTKLDLLDTVRCFSDETLNEASFTRSSMDTVRWYFDGAPDDFKKGTHIYFLTKMYPGMHEVKAEIIRGPCSHFIKAYFRVKGPLADMRIIDGEQCFSNRQVYLVENIRGSTRNNSIFRWHINDTFGANCYNNRIKDINKYTNCNHSLDWYTKHKFNGALKKQYEVSLWVKDTVTGCEDSINRVINMDYCSSLLDKDSVLVCVDRLFLEDIPPPFPIEFTVDSANQAWQKFPGYIDSTYKGNYDVGLRFKTEVSPWAENIGDDSIKVHTDTMTYYDTVYLKDYLHVKQKKKDSVYIKVYGNCRPFRVSLHFKNGLFHAGDSMYIAWGGGDSANFEKQFMVDTQLDSLFQTYNVTGFQSEIRIWMANKFGCESRYRISLERGKLLNKDYLRNGCRNKPNCFTPYIYDIPKKGFWTGNTQYNQVSWWFDDTGFVNAYNPCYRFKTGGKHAFRMIVRDSFGCQDTTTDTVFVQDIRANIKHHGKFVYCNELKQFFDSSFQIIYEGDSIKKYMWQFGAGVYSSLQKNPLQALNSSLEKIPAAHAIESTYGCRDTFRFEIQVIGPKPYFTIRDTIGCGSLNAVFDNLSRNCKQYIWQYGDSAQTTFQTFSKQPASFLYNKPGRYFISLVGIDTVFNPFTNSFQNCVATFPDKVFQKDTTRSVLVLPLRPTGISSRDTICLGSSLSFSSLSDTAYDNDEWNTGDTSSLIILPAGSSLSHTYKKTGVYTVRLKPGYNAALNNFCRDSAQKTVVVLGVKAGFDIDQASIPPVFRFHNTSQPASAALTWDFGHPGSGSSNSSSDNDPSHDYGKDTGTYTVCLVASLPEGCPDTICKTLFNDYMEAFGIYNVFTPGNIDNKNDQYDIQIENEDLYELMIYDRWGQLVFKANADDDADNPNWNGKVLNKGEDCPAGTYYYLFRYSLRHQPEILSVSGVITLIR